MAFALRKQGFDLQPTGKASKRIECSVAGCNGGAIKRGMCGMHYQRWRKRGCTDRHWTLDGEPAEWVRQHRTWQGEECLTWPFSMMSNGYGQINGWTGAHVFMCHEAHGPKPDDRSYVLHSCGRGQLGCVNPNHLRWGTQSENMADRIGHGTSNRGRRNGRAKLSDRDVIDIRERYANGDVLMRELAAQYGVARQYISQIIDRSRWGWL